MHKVEKGMHKVEKGSFGVSGAAPAGGAHKLAVAGLVLGFVGLASAFWVLNGPRVFAEIISAAWVLCF